MGFPGLLPLPKCDALSVSTFENVFQNDPSYKDEADLHRKLRGETHTLSNKNDLFWSGHTVVFTLVFKKDLLGASQIARQ